MMNLETTLHLIAGLGALVLGAGILAHGPSRSRNRYFAALCGAMALWALGIAGSGIAWESPPDWPPTDYWPLIYLLGGCAVAPLGLHFSLVLTGSSAQRRRWLLPPAYILAGLLWMSVAIRHRIPFSWPAIAITVLGGILSVALVVIARHALGLPRGAQRRAQVFIILAGVVAVTGAMSDFLGHPREFIRVGPITVLFFLLVVCAVIVRHRFFNVDFLLIRVMTLVLGTFAVTGLLYGADRLLPDSFGGWFVTALLVLAAGMALGRLLLGGADSLLWPSDPAALALLETSRRVARASSQEEVWQHVEAGRRQLPGNVGVDVYGRRPRQHRFHLVFRGEGKADAAPLRAEDPMPRLLAAEGLPLSRLYLELEAQESGANEADLEGTLKRFHERGLLLVVPFFTRDRMVGWIEVDDSLPESHLTAELAAAFLAVGNQAMASLERIAAFDRNRRRQSLAAIGELAAGLAHEVRNPVAAIRGAAQALTPEATPEQREEMLEVIEEESARLDRVVGDFLSYARPSPPQREPVDMQELVRRSLKGLELSGRRLVTDVHADAEAPLVEGDSDQLQQVVDNLVRNAWEAAGEDGQLHVEIYPEEKHHLAVRFEDSGPGVPEEDVARLFQPFFTTKRGGTGLGLALTHRIVTAHDGEIRVHDRPGGGAVFTVVLPISRTRGETASGP